MLALELAGALARRDDVRLRVTGAAVARRRARERSTRSGSSACGDEAEEDSVPTDVVHRPYQVTTPRDLLLLGRLGRRVVLTQQDLIAYHNPAYFDDYEECRGYRELTRLRLAFADRVVFCSPHAGDDPVVDAERHELRRARRRRGPRRGRRRGRAASRTRPGARTRAPCG